MNLLIKRQLLQKDHSILLLSLEKGIFISQCWKVSGSVLVLVINFVLVMGNIARNTVCWNS